MRRMTQTSARTSGRSGVIDLCVIAVAGFFFANFAIGSGPAQDDRMLFLATGQSAGADQGAAISDQAAAMALPAGGGVSPG